MDGGPPDETIEREDGLSVLLVYSRQWPRYVVDWSIRKQEGESDFPLAKGQVDTLPSADRAPEDLWDSLRERALAEVQSRQIAAPPRPKSFLSRLFGQR